MVSTSTCLILYALVTGWVEKNKVEQIWGNWKDWATTSTTMTVEEDDSRPANSIESLLAVKAKGTITSIAATSASPSPSPSPSRSRSNNVTFEYFTQSRMMEINKSLDAGNLSVYKWHETLQSSSRRHSNQRLIIVGDLHGTHRSLFKLLDKISFTPSRDRLLHTGDILSKSSLSNSLDTVRLLNKLGAKGVRGNHDQKILEWRNWMESLGPLDQTKLKKQDDVEKRDWLSWLSSDNGSNRDDRVLETGEEGDEEVTSSSQVIASISSSRETRPSDRRRPFGQRPNRLSSTTLTNSTTSSTDRIARPRPSSSSSSTSARNTTLLGTFYSHLDPTLTVSQRSALGIESPLGWEWGGQHFEIARHLTRSDVEYLKDLPLTLWVQELNSFIVHAGLGKS